MTEQQSGQEDGQASRDNSRDNSREKRSDDLSLYGYPQCPYCQRVLMATHALGLEIELRNIRNDDAHRRDLVEAMGRSTVPVLRIEGEGGEVEWLPESEDIVDYLEARFDSAESADAAD